MDSCGAKPAHTHLVKLAVNSALNDTDLIPEIDANSLGDLEEFTLSPGAWIPTGDKLFG